MGFPPQDYPEFANNILDRLEQKLRTDARIPQALRNNVERMSPAVDGAAYPILYFEEGEDQPVDFTTSGRKDHQFTVRLVVVAKQSDRRLGPKQSKDLVFAVVKALTDTLDDVYLRDSAGNALARRVDTAQTWGEEVRTPRNETLWMGVITVTVTAEFRS